MSDTPSKTPQRLWRLSSWSTLEISFIFQNTDKNQEEIVGFHLQPLPLRQPQKAEQCEETDPPDDFPVRAVSVREKANGISIRVGSNVGEVNLPIACGAYSSTSDQSLSSHRFSRFSDAVFLVSLASLEEVG